ncbi:leucyl/phenylalanyl-tRNA--protein transferase [Arcobacter roscoffensis]|uniref:Leucyl/phenylalanyl-tRNA--protein transferase n=1 Tax=Arcobacter roscoffensis TaxID=2961520 RepID=A0ABY5E161_9BACT|nr:leucyl/phenylalanyl-tRNA--protein transferase [Arcobacter roscoffensis]UTJ05942.1 leucyl/phenylalanyl-tRNA--protein transferase [Arcobacter roscoffensis]
MNLNIYPLDKYSFNFPDPLYCNDEGLIAYGGDLNPNRIITAYTKGIFPWYNQNDPILWWSPNPRMVLELDEFKVSRSLAKTISKNIYEIKFDKNFEQTIIECANARKHKEGTWILDEVVEAYIKLHDMNFAHSFEAYFDGELVGGGYGINIGNIFCGESMFAKKSDASKVALFYLVQRLKKSGFKLIDCQVPSLHLESLGAKNISRKEFLSLVENSICNPKVF